MISAIQTDLLPKEKRSAIFSDDRVYRYTLEIVWDDGKPLAQFIGLNPSTADEVKDDPTIRKCKQFAKNCNRLSSSKYLIILLAVVAAGCEGRVRITQEPLPTAPNIGVNVSRDPAGYFITKHTIEGHDYLTYFQGGLLHSESCTNSVCVPMKTPFRSSHERH